jgi:hypothetical protein
MSLPLYRCIAVDAEMPVAWDADEYSMQHKRRGHAVISNHDTFDTNDYAPREGYRIDVKDLHALFCLMSSFITNLEYSKIKEVISTCM